MKVGDLVRLKNQGNGQPGFGVVYERTPAGWRGKDELNEFKCLWDDSQWNHSFYFECDLEVISESR
mgnify:FL=1|jgi:hypothetical protein